MAKSAIDASKTKLLDGLLDIYTHEINAIHGINVSWNLLKKEARDKCSDDFDQALIARETLLEELMYLRDDGIKTTHYDSAVQDVDQKLLEHKSVVKDLYGLDVKTFLNVKTPKSLPGK